jgi:probable rRNA maturation factor
MSEKKPDLEYKLELDVQYPDARLEAAITPELVETWVRASLLGPAELAVRFVDAAEGQQLNRD